MKRLVILASILLVFGCNFETTHSDVHQQVAGPDYDGIGLSFVSIALSFGWCLYFGVPLAGLIVSAPRRAEASKRWRAAAGAGDLRLFPCARLYFIAAPLLVGFRGAWFSETAQRYTRLSFGSGASWAPVLLTVAAVTLLNVYMAVIGGSERGRGRRHSLLSTC